RCDRRHGPAEGPYGDAETCRRDQPPIDRPVRPPQGGTTWTVKNRTGQTRQPRDEKGRGFRCDVASIRVGDRRELEREDSGAPREDAPDGVGVDTLAGDDCDSARIRIG